ncbi:meteorin-like protein [Macrosteles quadrilineatus]|uniref:meteorin-like protein n=1 Tax=Macrosteles quadrilineatus TaxID=74068 RepID=UPI0023E22EC0|nr:meteorin-like protein [Macrosteles quadrilineatus]
MWFKRPRGRLRAKDPPVYLFLTIFLWTFTFFGASLATVMGEECDWSGSGLHPARGVTPVYLRCSQGRVTWSYPGGALRVLLRLGSSGREFRGCIKSSASWAGARVFLEGPRSLVRLLDQEDSRQKVRCFHSRGGQAALYVEATGAATFPKQVAELFYDLEALPRHSGGYHASDECRPCSKEEMTHAFCTSDLVTRGIIRSVENQEDLETSSVTVKVTKHLRHSSSTITSDGEEEEEENSIFPEKENLVQLSLPGHCGAKHGTGEFVFMARRKLGDLAITCAPRLEDWVEVVRTESLSGSANCVLNS